MILSLVDEAVRSGARLQKACEVIELPARTLQRWREQGPQGGDDRRHGSKTPPANKLSEAARAKVVQVATSEAMRDLSPRQIVPRLADQGDYLCSESTMYRVLEEQGLKTHRGPVKARTNKRPKARAATGPNQLLCWDITYLPAAVRGKFFYLYVFLAVWSRKIVGWGVSDKESADFAAQLLQATCDQLRVKTKGIVLHSDNGSPMKGATMLAMMTSLGIVSSFSRPRVSDDNPFIEALFRTLKYRPDHHTSRFQPLQEAVAAIEAFVRWYNHDHLHSAIGFVTPQARHVGADLPILAHRRLVYEQAHAKHPERWTRNVRPWDRPSVVHLNPDRVEGVLRDEVPRAAREIAAIAAVQRAGIGSRSAEEVLRVLREDTPVSVDLAAWAVGVWQRSGGAAAAAPTQPGAQPGQDDWIGDGAAGRWVADDSDLREPGPPSAPPVPTAPSCRWPARGPGSRRSE